VLDAGNAGPLSRVARAFRSGWMADTAGSSRSERIVLLCIARAQIILGGHPRVGAAMPHAGRNPRSTTASTAAIRAPLMTSIRLALAPPGTSSASRRAWPARGSIVLLVPNGLPQAIHRKGSSSFSTRSGAFHAGIQTRLKRDDLLGTGGLAKPHCTQRLSVKTQHRAVGIIR